MTYILAVIAAAALITLYKFFPSRKIFAYFCAMLLIVFCVSSFIQSRSSQEENISRAQIEKIRRQEEIFASWYTAYQKNIDRLDINWQLYFSIVETLKTAEIYEYSTYEQLVELERDMLKEQTRIYLLNVPPEFDAECRMLLTEVIIKTQAYVDAQVKTISLTREAANPETATDLALLNKKIREITIRESPAGLFTAKEISAIRDKLTVPEEAELK